MIEIESYMNDGANWQAQAVLAAVRYFSDFTLDTSYDEKKKTNRAKIVVGRYENCREQGYVLTLLVDWQTIYNIAFYEHRNTENICVKGFEGSFINTPRAEDLKMKDKWDFDKSFELGQIMECAEWIDTIFEKKLTETLEEK